MEMFKTLTSVLLAGDNTIEFTDSNITDTSILDCYLTDSELIIEESSQIGTTVSITVSNHTEPVGVALFINNCDTFTPYDDTDVQNELLQLDTRMTLLENNKQDKLTAGENITIENNVISAIGGSSGDIIPSGDIQSTSIYEGGNNDDYTYTVLEDGYYVAIVRLSAQSTGNASITINGNMSLYNVENQNRLAGVHVSSGLLHLARGCTIRVIGAYCTIYKYTF